MKFNFLTMALLLGAVSASAGLSPSAEERAKGFIDNEAERTLTFIFDNNLWKVSGVSKVQVAGSFTGWSLNSTFTLSHQSDGDFWYVTVPYKDVKIPGNSGQPEYKFVVNGSNWLSGSSKSFIPEGYVFRNGDNNSIVVFDSDDFETIKENSRTANVLKSLSDFDLSTEEGKEALSNFRQVPATTQLFRCYHPYKWTKSSNPTEPVRMQTITELAQAHGVKCDICLSENAEHDLTSYTINGTRYTEEIPAYYKEFISAGRVLYVGASTVTPTYNAVYYSPTTENFAGWVREIVDFILDDNHPGPYTIHCRIGTDRTGVFSGLLAAFCGATWQQIAADYQLTNRMGIQEFRDYHLLQYSFQQILGVEDISEVEDLQQAMTEYFVSHSYLTQSQIEAVAAKLNGLEYDQPIEVPPTPAQPGDKAPAKLYLLGHLAQGAWDTNGGIEMTPDGNTYRAKDVDIAASSDGNGYFAFTTTRSSSWDTVNASDRYGATSKNAPIQAGQTLSMRRFKGGSEASGCYSWAAAPGKYDISADFEAMTITMVPAESTSISDVDIDDVAPVYYNLQGVRVDTPTTGLYIVVRGNSVSKQFIH